VLDLFEHQIRAVKSLERWLDSNESTGLLCLPTGAGKTRTAAAFVVEQMIARGPVLWLAHRTELIDQAVNTFESARAPRPVVVGRWHRERTVSPVDVLVGSIPTLTFAYKRGGRNLSRMLDVHPRFSLVVVDECHHGVAETWTWLIEELRRRIPGVRILGLSATPTRHAEQEQPLLWKIFGQVVHEEPVLDLIDSGVLARPTIIPVDTQLTFDATKTEQMVLDHGGDIPASLLEQMAESEARNTAVVDAYLERREAWGQTLVFATTVEQARWITNRLRTGGVNVLDVYAGTPAVERAKAIDAFRAKRARVLVNVGLFTEGTDLPGVETLFLARPTRSRLLFQQMVGRGMRGPRIGGVESVAVVAFHDSIVGLLQERLASCFASEREALLALGFPGERLEKIAATKAAPNPAMDRLVRVARDLLSQSEGAKTGTSLPLRGFWEARNRTESAFLPVFGNELSIVSSWVNYLRYTCRARGTPAVVPEGLLLPPTVVTPFVRIVVRVDGKVRWVDLERAERDEIFAAAEGLERARAASPAPAPPPVTPRAPPQLLERLRKRPRSEWRALVREELARSAGGQRDETDAVLALLESALVPLGR
jgi:superfamily II DNA or RNA helicase